MTKAESGSLRDDSEMAFLPDWVLRRDGSLRLASSTHPTSHPPMPPRLYRALHRLGSFQNESSSNVLPRIKLAAGMHIAERREPQVGGVVPESMSRRFSGCAAVPPTLNGEKIVCRVLDAASV